MAPRAFDAIVFDLDGTLIDSVPDVRNALNVMLARRGRRALSVDEVRLTVGEGARMMLERVFAATGGPEANFEAALADYLAAYSANPVIDTVVYPGAVAALDRLAAAGTRLAICTNKPEGVTRLVIDALGLSSRFDAIIGGDTLPFRKPDPRHVLETLRLTNVPPTRAAYVGDSETDVAAAKGAGLPVVVVTFGYGHNDIDALGADALIGHFDHLDTALEGLR
jgi:2-phosphoglycolate phosphatase, prokaryotic